MERFFSFGFKLFGCGNKRNAENSHFTKNKCTSMILCMQVINAFIRWFYCSLNHHSLICKVANESLSFLLAIFSWLIYMIFDTMTSVTSINYFMVICDCETFRCRDSAAYE